MKNSSTEHVLFKSRFVYSLFAIFVVLQTRCVVAQGGRDSGDDEAATSSTASSSSSQECVVNNEGRCENGESKWETEHLTEVAKEATTHSDEKNDVWTMGTAWDIAETLDCPWDDPYGYTEIHSDEIWRAFNRIYNEIVGLENSAIPPAFETNGFQYEIEIKFQPGIGRGVFTKEPIPKGALVYECINSAQFQRGQDYRDFLKRLPPKLACDVIIWAYTRLISKELEDTYMVCVDLDEGSFVNTGKTDHECNMELGVGGLLPDDAEEDATWYGCKMQFYANRDIAPGEEIRADYGDFAEPQGWKHMGL